MVWKRGNLVVDVMVEGRMDGRVACDLLRLGGIVVLVICADDMRCVGKRRRKYKILPWTIISRSQEIQDSHSIKYVSPFFI